MTTEWFGQLSGGQTSAVASVVGAPGPGVPSGGATGQVLAKIDGTAYNVEWVTLGGGSNPTIDPQAGNLLTTSSAGLFVNGALDLGTFN